MKFKIHFEFRASLRKFQDLNFWGATDPPHARIAAQPGREDPSAIQHSGRRPTLVHDQIEGTLQLEVSSLKSKSPKVVALIVEQGHGRCKMEEPPLLCPSGGLMALLTVMVGSPLGEECGAFRKPNGRLVGKLCNLCRVL
jgi:hypothetical protein